MPQAHPRRLVWPLLLLGMLVAACQAQPLRASGATPEVALQQRIDAEIGSAACSSSSECRTLPIGSKACGGPARWVAWSASVSREDQLRVWSQELAERQRQRDMAEGRMSTCSVVADPGARCDAGRCVLASGGLLR